MFFKLSTSEKKIVIIIIFNKINLIAFKQKLLIFNYKYNI